MKSEAYLRRMAQAREHWRRALALRQQQLTYAQIGKVLGVCVERARQLVERARRDARHGARPGQE